MDPTTTLREDLNSIGFDWENGVIIYQETHGYSPGWSYTDEIEPGKRIKATHPILDQHYTTDYGAPQCPRFVARDAHFIYFPCQYDGATWIEKVAVDPLYYTEEGNKTPYPGGG
jgi:hypothetical protein